MRKEDEEGEEKECWEQSQAAPKPCYANYSRDW